MENIASLHKVCEQLATLRRGVQGREQFQQLGLHARPRILLQGSAEGQSSRAPALGDACAVGGHEGKGILCICLVLCQMQRHTSDTRPLRGIAIQKCAQAPALAGLIHRPGQQALPQLL